MICALGAIARFVAHRGYVFLGSPLSESGFMWPRGLKNCAFKAFVAAQRHSQSSNIQNFQIRLGNMRLKQVYLSHLFYQKLPGTKVHTQINVIRKAHI